MKEKKSSVVIAKDVLQGHGKSMNIHDLFAKVIEQKVETEGEKQLDISQFYTYLTLDGDFVILSDGSWDLRDNHPFDVVNKISTDFDLAEDEEEEETDEEEYDALDTVALPKEDEESEGETEANEIKDLIGYDKEGEV